MSSVGGIKTSSQVNSHPASGEQGWATLGQESIPVPSPVAVFAVDGSSAQQEQVTPKFANHEDLNIRLPMVSASSSSGAGSPEPVFGRGGDSAPNVAASAVESVPLLNGSGSHTSWQPKSKGNQQRNASKHSTNSGERSGSQKKKRTASPGCVQAQGESKKTAFGGKNSSDGGNRNSKRSGLVASSFTEEMSVSSDKAFADGLAAGLAQAEAELKDKEDTEKALEAEAHARQQEDARQKFLDGEQFPRLPIHPDSTKKQLLNFFKTPCGSVRSAVPCSAVRYGENPVNSTQCFADTTSTAVRGAGGALAVGSAVGVFALAVAGTMAAAFAAVPVALTGIVGGLINKAAIENDEWVPPVDYERMSINWFVSSDAEYSADQRTVFAMAKTMARRGHLVRLVVGYSTLLRHAESFPDAPAPVSVVSEVEGEGPCFKQERIFEWTVNDEFLSELLQRYGNNGELLADRLVRMEDDLNRIGSPFNIPRFGGVDVMRHTFNLARLILKYRSYRACIDKAESRLDGRPVIHALPSF